MSDIFSDAKEKDPRKIRAKLMSKISGDSEMFALGSSIAKVVQAVGEEETGTKELAYFVMSDVSLTQRVLRIANTVMYRGSSGANVTKVSHAISLLGLDRVRAVALTLLLVDALANNEHARAVRAEIEIALRASLLAREVGHGGNQRDSEDASTAALFKNLGSLLIATHEPDLYADIQRMVREGTKPEQAAIATIGCTLDALTGAVLEEWKIPESIVRATAPATNAQKRQPQSRTEWQRVSASFGSDAGKILAKAKDGDMSSALESLRKEYASAFPMDASQMANLFDRVNQELTTLLESLNLDDVSFNTAPEDVVLDAEFMLGESEPVTDEVARHPSGKPLRSREMLIATLEAATELRVRDASVNDLIHKVIDGLYASLGFRFTTICLKNTRRNLYHARISAGASTQDHNKNFSFHEQERDDIFSLAMKKNADLVINDARVEKVTRLLPAWYKAAFGDVKSFIVLPLVVGNRRLGLVYGDRLEPAPEGIPPDEVSLIRSLKSHLISVLEKTGR